MKNLILTLTILTLCLNSKGQTDSSTTWTTLEGISFWKVGERGSLTLKILDSNAIVRIVSFPNDTIPVIILYSDTTTCYSTSEHPEFTNGKLRYVTDTFNVYKMAWVNWAKAYMVYNRSIAYERSKGYDDTSQYLDENKQPLKKSFIIWQTKIIQ